MRRALAFVVSTSLFILFIGGCQQIEEPLPEEGDGRTAFFKHGPPAGGAPYAYFLTSYGAPGDACTGTPACGGKPVDGTWYYATGAFTFGCHTRLRLEANGKCVVVEVVDNGPAAWVEQKAASKCGGTGYIIDASPLVSKHLFGSKSAGWSDCFAIKVTPVAASTPTGPQSCASAGPEQPGTPGQPAAPSQPANPCGNGKLDSGELCDSAIPAGSAGACPKSCDDGDSCTSDELVGSGCQARCLHTNGCTEPVCGNGQVEPGEWCDTAIPAGSAGACPTSCDDGNPCTSDLMMGSGCLAVCANPPVAGCGNSAGGGSSPAAPATESGGRAVGAPCSSNAQCLSGQCLSALSGFSGGMCSRPCATACEQPAGETEAACIELEGYATLSLTGGGSGTCYALCNFSLSPTGCRSGYRCVSRRATDGITQSVCLPESQAGNAPAELPPAPEDGVAEGDLVAAADADAAGVLGGCSVGGSADLGLTSLLLLGWVLLGRRRKHG
jgi:hypothetical protein